MIPTADDDELRRRALAAYFRNPVPGVPDAVMQQPSSQVRVREISGRRYVELYNGKGRLAVYRVLPDGRLKRLRRPPVELAA